MNGTMGLTELVLILRKRMALILVISIGSALISGIVSYYFMTPIYQTSTQILVNKKKQDEKFIELNEVQANLQLTNTYKDIIKSPVILNQVKEKLGLNIKIDQLKDEIDVGKEKDSQILVVTVQDKNANLARDIANTTAEVFKGEVAKIMNVDNVTVLSKAEVAKNQSPIKPRPMLNVAIAFVVGLMASVVLAFLLEYLDNSVKKEEDIESLLGLPVLGIVASMDEETMNVKSQAPLSKKARGQTIGS
ncbi:YveK family protein [Bacillus toyonensis]|uniref:YveK family protein n=1 Tax=Bacillus toyonensis TaxID=155322 RepID=UPI000BEF2A19|nr:Wzz/FepE/Etk N-terminal domain-containing protein [Bacillus toyonensis]PEK05807.1 capsular biosynthesis protein [Bacillus toyonensis]PGA57667.1 capsular biosynthesis protein [Bacillus toyonensis]PGB94434.1 capsular biosynthesis protein [Bacillus toyonensis]